MVKKHDDRAEFFELVHKEYLLLHKSGVITKLRDLFRQAKDSYEQKYIYSLLTNEDFGVSKYIKSRDVFTLKKEKLDINIDHNLELLAKIYNHASKLDPNIDISSGGKYGYMYVLDNHGIPGLVKIGFTCNSAFDRAKQLSTTSVPYPFKVRYLARVRRPEKVEKKVHELLRHKRVNNSREFFNVTIEEAIKAIESEATYLNKQDSSQRF